MGRSTFLRLWMITQKTLGFFVSLTKMMPLKHSKKLWKRITIENNASIGAVRSDRGGEFISERL